MASGHHRDGHGKLDVHLLAQPPETAAGPAAGGALPAAQQPHRGRSLPVVGLLYPVHVRTRKFRNLEKTKRYVVPAPRANSKTQGGTRSDSDSICHRHHSVFSGFLTV